MKKVLFMIHDLGHGGAEKVLVNLVNNMDQKQFDITVMALFGGGVNQHFLKPGIRYYSVFPRSIPGNSHIMKLLSPELLHRLFIKEKYDIEIAYLEGSAARVISGCQECDTRLVCWIHVEQHTEPIAAKAFRSFRESAECYCRFHKIVCVSQAVKEDFLQLYPMLDSAEVLYNTNETAQILKQKEEPVEADVFQEGEIRLCGVGKLMPIKGFDRLARIHCRLRKEGYPIHCYVLGVGPEQKKIEQYLAEQQMESSFTFLGYQTNPYKYVARCDLFVCASTAEGFSTAATEALIVGIPVCTVEVSGMREMLGDNEYGVITQNNEEALYQAIKGLLEHPEKLNLYKERAIERGKTFNTESTVNKVELCFKNLL